MNNLTFNGIKKPWLRLLRGRTKPPFSALKRNLLYVPGMPGAYLQSTDVEPLVINQPVGFGTLNDEHALQLKDELADWLVTDEAVELQFDNEPGRTYFAVVNNTMNDFEKMATLRRGTIQFLCFDPYGYSQELTATFPSDAVTITNNGTAEADPIFQFIPNKSVTHIDIANQDAEYMRIGRPSEVDDTLFEPETLILNDSMGTTTGWGQASTVDNGSVTGEMGADGDGFYPSTFGTVVNGGRWQGPSLKRSLSAGLQDFRMDAHVKLENIGYDTGMVEIYLLDSGNNTVAKIGIEDRWNAIDRVFAKAQLGGVDGPFIASEYADRDDYWNNYDGILRIQREGNRWSVYFAVLKDGKHINTLTTVPVYVDVDSAYMAPITQVQVAMRVYPDTEAAPMKVRDIKIWRINQEPEGVPYIARANDVITFDHKEENLLINGEPRIDLKDFGGTYFKLKKGDNQLFVFPQNTFETSLRYRERYK